MRVPPFVLHQRWAFALAKHCIGLSRIASFWSWYATKHQCQCVYQLIISATNRIPHICSPKQSSGANLSALYSLLRQPANKIINSIWTECVVAFWLIWSGAHNQQSTAHCLVSAHLKFLRYCLRKATISLQNNQLWSWLHSQYSEIMYACCRNLSLHQMFMDDTCIYEITEKLYILMPKWRIAN
jgi:hypothetical protein